VSENALDNLLSHWIPAPPGTRSEDRVKVCSQTPLFLHLAKKGDHEGMEIFISTKHPAVRQSIRQVAVAMSNHPLTV